jgi:tRNA threonylcarbamoyladenosine biosynthesis protein TsaB
VLLLGIDTATPQVSVAFGDATRVLGEVHLAGGRRHAEQLAPAIDYLRGELAVDLGQLAAIAVGLGPGLFTGMRVGVTTAKVMAQALRIPVVGVPSLDLVAYELRHTTRMIVVVFDARRREVFHARYVPVPGGVQRVSEYEVGPPADLVADLEAHDDELLLAGDGIEPYRREFAALDHAEPAGPGFERPHAGALVELATARVQREEFAAPWDVHPMYLRRSDAEIEWDRRARR